jgi:alkyl hydroperoxide reductase subunit F
MDFNLSSSTFTAEPNFKPLNPEKIYDVLILGGGPAGLTAAVYCIRKGVSTGLIVKEIGGQVAITSGVENYLGYRYINGVELVEKFRDQVSQFGIDYDEGDAVKAIESGTVKKIIMEDGRSFSTKSLIIATGKSWRKLNVPGEDKFMGHGVAYCSTCDAPFFAGRRVIVVGGGNSGVEAAIDLAKVAQDVVVVQFLDRLTADKILTEKLGEFKNVHVMYEREVASINGRNSMESAILKNRRTGAQEEIIADGIFIEIGLIPNSAIAKGLVGLNSDGEIMVDCSCRTNVPGIFAAGDVTDVPFKQIIVAGGEGAKAALSACNYVLQMDTRAEQKG